MKSDLILLAQDRIPDLDAGEFSAWLDGMRRALDGQGQTDVPCGECNACCRSSYFIELRPADTGARELIPAVLLFDAPGAPAGYQVLGYDEKGRCPMLRSGACSIYQARPGTCRTYDCRTFAATGIAEPGAEKADVTARAARWRFSYRDEAARQTHRILQLGTRVLIRMVEEDLVPGPGNATQLAMLSIRLFPAFSELGEHLAEAGAAESRQIQEKILGVLAALRD